MTAGFPVLVAVMLLSAVAGNDGSGGSPNPGVNASCYRYGDSNASLRGRVVVRKEYGPPNFGENPKTDQMDRAHIGS